MASEPVSTRTRRRRSFKRSLTVQIRPEETTAVAEPVPDPDMVTDSEFGDAPLDWGDSGLIMLERVDDTVQKISGTVITRTAPLARLVPSPLRTSLYSIWQNLTPGAHTWRIVVVAALFFSCVTPLLLLPLNAWQEYNQIKQESTAALNDLTSVRDILASEKGFEAKAKAFFQPAVLDQVQQHSQSAYTHFATMEMMLTTHAGVIGLANFTPYADKLASVVHLARIGKIVSLMADDLATNGRPLASLFDAPLFASDGPPVFTPTAFDTISSLLYTYRPDIVQIGQELDQVNLAGLPLKASQIKELQAIKTQFPHIAAGYDSLLMSLPAVRWILGVDQPRNYLIQTLDRGELRASGGFTGGFGVLSLNGGRLGKISLTDISLLDLLTPNFYDTPYPLTKVRIPEQYASWWPYSDWGMRDANLSVDFPTSAQLVMHTFTAEGGPPVDGLIQISPIVIAHLLEPDILGPLTMPCYGVTVTDQNLEDTIHYFQLGGGAYTSAGCNTTDTTSYRKRFTADLASLLQARVRDVPLDIQQKVLGSLLTDFAHKDVQVYFSGAEAKQLLAEFDRDSALIRTSAIDSTIIVQSNVGANKGSIYVTSNAHEQIAIDQNGNAYHSLSLQLDYQPTGNVYAYDGGPNVPKPLAYRDYIRVYVPAGTKYLMGTGFEQVYSEPYCFAGRDESRPCAPPNGPICQETVTNPTGAFLPGAIPPSRGNLMGSGDGVIYRIGPPTNVTSDETGRAMMGGLVVLPPFCRTTVVLQWVVPGAAPSLTTQPYTFAVQRQSGVNINYAVDINATALDIAPLHLGQQPLLVDQRWTFGGRG